MSTIEKLFDSYKGIILFYIIIFIISLFLSNTLTNINGESANYNEEQETYYA